MMRFFSAMAVLIAVCASGVPADDQAVIAQLYGQGVHAYFAQDYVRAYELLTTAIERGTTDPRVYYYRGLALRRLGRPEDASADFSLGAEREAKDLNKFYNVSKALERVQGEDRQAIERHRVDARVAVMQEAERILKARYEARREAERQVLVGPPETIKPEEIKPVKPLDSSAHDPFSAPATAPAIVEEKPSQPAATPKPAEQDPFGGPTTPAAPAKPAETDPFGTPAAPAQPNMPAEKPEETDPFGTPAATPKTEENNPFGTPAAGGTTTNTASESKPKGGILRAFQRAAGKALGGGEAADATPPQATPFGPLPKPEVAPMPGVAPATPGAGEVDDPFGDAEPTAPGAMPKPADDDPFGAPAAGGAKPPANNNPFEAEPSATQQPAADAPHPPKPNKPVDDDPFAN